MKEKASLRKNVLKARSLMTEEENRRFSRIICGKVTRLDAWKKARTIYIYASFQGEVDTHDLIREAWRSGKRAAVPKVKGDDLIFLRIESFGELKEGYKGIPEPSGTKEENDPEAFVVMPGAVFDEQRNRIGYGKGYYDRFLEKNPHHKTAALAFDLQVMKEEIPHEKTDLRPDAVVTQTRIIR